MRYLGMIIGGLCVTGPAVDAQYVVQHQPGIVMPADLNGDRFDDLVLWTGTEVHTYFGQQQLPFLRAAQVTAIESARRAQPRPVVSGGHLYLPRPGAGADTHGYVDVHRLEADGSLTKVITYRVDPIDPAAAVSSIKVVPIGWDFDGDRRNDALVVWTDWPAPAAAQFSACYASPLKLGNRLAVPRLAGQPELVVFAGLHRTSNPAHAPDDTMVILSSHPAQSFAGFGHLLLHRGANQPVAGPGRWIGSAPALGAAGLLEHASPTTYGNFQPSPILGTPLMKMKFGPSILFHPDTIAPYVTQFGSWIRTSRAGFFIDDATADYDGDGVEEVVFVEPRPTGIGDPLIPDLVVVADPGEHRSYVQAFDYPPLATAAGTTGGGTESTLFHGAAVDINGDGARDLVLSCSRRPATGSFFSVILGAPKGVPGQPTLRRAY